MMNYDILYSIAVDLIKKRSVQSQNVNDCVCVLMTEKSSIFTGISTSAIEDGKLVPVCAEHEAIKIMLSSNETKISALVTVNCQSLSPWTPCDTCKKLIMEVNANNSDTMIMMEDKTFSELRNLLDDFDTEQSIWEMGWDDTPNDPVQDSRNTSPMSDLTMPNLLNNSSRYNYNSSMTFNPIPQPQASKLNMPTYQARPLSGGGSIYMESIAVPTPSSTLRTAVVPTSNSTFAQRQNANSTMDDNARFRERLKGIMADDSFKATPVQVKKNDAMPEPKPIPKDMPSRKQLKAIAKEKKKQAKKNLKIMESMEKYDKGDNSNSTISRMEKYGRDDR